MRKAIAVLMILIGSNLFAARFDCDIKAPPASEQQRLVWQFTELLSTYEVNKLDAKLTQFARETSNRILVLVVDTLCGYPESDLAFEIGEKWGIGKAGFDNGLVILIKPTGPPGQRVVFIATGYGLEGTIPDLTTKRVIDREILPRFAEQQYYEGLDRATDVLMGLAKGEFDERSYGEEPAAPIGGVIMFLVIMLIVFLSWRGRVKRYARTNKLDFWTAMFLLSQMNKRHGRGGGFGGFGGGGFGGGGGGFGGFGGGGFGGGGAGGRW